MIPAMQIHLLDCKSDRQLARKLAWSKIGDCMMVVSELRDTYWGADFTLKLFEVAQTLLKDRQNQDDMLQNKESTNAEKSSANVTENTFLPDAFYMMGDYFPNLDQAFDDLS
jgi:hypothetical protein